MGELIRQAFPENSEANIFSYEVWYKSLLKVKNERKTNKLDRLRYDIPKAGLSSFREAYWKVENIPLLGPDGEVAFVFHLISEVSQQVLSERQAKKKKVEREAEFGKKMHRFQALIQEGSDLMVFHEKNGRYKFLSDSTFSVLGIAPKELVGKNLIHFVHEEDLSRIREVFQKLENEKQIKVAPFRFRDKKGTWRWLESTATNLLTDPAVEGIITNSRGVTKIFEQTRKIESINERFRLAATATQVLITTGT